MTVNIAPYVLLKLESLTGELLYERTMQDPPLLAERVEGHLFKGPLRLMKRGPILRRDD